jgi:hypothetical protein
MARWGLCLGCVFGAIAVAAVVATMRWLDGPVAWAGWGAFALFGWAAVMAVYSFDRPARSHSAGLKTRGGT